MIKSTIFSGRGLRIFALGLFALAATVTVVAQYDIAEEPFWPFTPADEIMLFGPSGLRVDISEKDPVYKWNRTIREFAAERKAMVKLNGNQEDVLDQLAELRSLFSLDSVLLSDMERRGKPYQLFLQAQDNEAEIDKIQESLRTKCRNLIGDVPAIQSRLIDVRSRLDAASLELRERNKDAAPSRLTQADILNYKQQLSDAIDRLALIAKDKENALDHLMNAMNSYSSGAYESNFLVQGLEDRIQRLMIRNKAATHQINVDERELRSLARQIDLLVKRQEELQRIDAEKEMSSALESQIAAKQERLRREAVQRAAEAEVRAAAEARKREDEERLRKEKEAELAKVEKKVEEESKARQEAEMGKEVETKARVVAEQEKELADQKRLAAEQERQMEELARKEAEKQAEARSQALLKAQQDRLAQDLALAEAGRKAAENERARLEAERKSLEEERKWFEAEQEAAAAEAEAKKEIEEKELLKIERQTQAKAEADTKAQSALGKESPKKKKSFWGKIITLGGLIGSSDDDDDEKKEEVKKKPEEKK